MAVCRKFELDLGNKGLIYHLFVQPSVFFSARLKNRRSRRSVGLPDMQRLCVMWFRRWSVASVVICFWAYYDRPACLNAGPGPGVWSECACCLFCSSGTRNIRFRIAALIKSSASSEVISSLFFKTRFRSDILISFLVSDTKNTYPKVRSSAFVSS